MADSKNLNKHVEGKKYAAKCPHCQTKLRVRREDLGANRTCPKCKQVFAVPDPGAARANQVNTSPPDNPSSESSSKTDDWTPPVHIPVACGRCKTRYYAAENQVGQSLPCPDCHTDNLVVAPAPARAAGLRPLDASERGIGFERGLPSRNPDQFRVTCQVCETVLYCLPKHVGKKVRCSDCGTILPVPKPPPQKTKSTVPLEDPGINVRPEAVIPVVKSNADQLLKKAAHKYHEIEASKQKPPERPWRDKVWTLPFQLEILPVFIAICLLTGFLGCLGAIALESDAVFETILSAAIAVPTVLLTANTLMAIAVSSSMGHTRIEFPKFEMFAYLTTALFAINAVAVTYGPGISVGLLIGIPWISLVAVTFAFAGFPIVFLSMLDASSPAVPYTRYIGQTLKENRAAWIRFYLMAFGLLIPLIVPHFANTLAFVLLRRSLTTELRLGLFVVAVVISVYSVFVYFCLIGRLVWVIDQSGRSTEDDEKRDKKTDKSPAMASA